MELHDAGSIFDGAIDEHVRVADACRDSLRAEFERFVRLGRAALRGGGKLLLFGNGGSAADAQHIAAEFVVRFERKRRAMPAIALTTDASILTATGNDLGFETIFARQIVALGRPGDLAIGISTSGRSTNVLMALREARRSGLDTVLLTGAGAQPADKDADLAIVVPSKRTARIQEMHMLIGHAFCSALEQDVRLEQEAGIVG
jgi:D-sedoheptulose 7-phosphate isomerase